MDAQTRSSVVSRSVEPHHPSTKSIIIEVERMDEVCLIRFRGHFRSGDNPEYLARKMKEVQALNSPKVLVDFWNVPTIGSAGLSFLIGLYRTSAGRFVLVGVQPRVREVLDITHLSNVLPLVADIASGLVALGTRTTQFPRNALKDFVPSST